MRRPDPCRRLRRGVALPLALFVLVVTGLFAGLLLDSALQAARAARAGLAESRAAAAAEDVLSAALVQGVDSARASMAMGVGRDSAWSAGLDSLDLLEQSLGGSRRRLYVRATTRAPGTVAVAGIVAWVTIVADSAAGAGHWRRHPIAGWWRSPIQ